MEKSDKLIDMIFCSKRIRFSHIFVLLSLVIFVFSGVTIQKVSASTGISSPSQIPAACNLINNRVKIGISSADVQAVSGQNFVVKGTIKNQNPYPIPNASLVARIVKLPKTTGDTYDTATDVVARFVVTQDLFLGIDSEQSFLLNWSVPDNLPSGSYMIDFFVNSSGMFAVGGNEYLGIPVGSRPVRVLGTTKSAVFLDQSSIKVDGIEPFTSKIADINGTDKAQISVDVLNTYKNPRSVSVVWSVYDSSFADASSILSSKSDIIHLLSGEKRTLSFLATGMTQSEYLVVGDIVDKAKISRVSVRIHRLDTPKPVVRSFVLNTFPLEIGKTSAVFGCVSNSVSDLLSTTTVNVSITDSLGDEVYTGSFLSPNNKPFLEFIGTFSPNKKFVAPLTLSLTALNSHGSSTELASVIYKNISTDIWNSLSDGFLKIYAPLIALVVFVLFFIFLRKRKI